VAAWEKHVYLCLTPRAVAAWEEHTAVGTSARLSPGHIQAGCGSRAAQGTRGWRGVLSQQHVSDIFSSASQTGNKYSLSKASCLGAVFRNHQGIIIKGEEKAELSIQEHGEQSITSLLLIKIL